MGNLRLLLFLLILLSAEIFLLILLLISIAIERLRSYTTLRHKEKKKQKIAALVLTAMETKKLPEDIKPKGLAFLEVLENFNLRVQGEEWGALKLSMTTPYLIPQARDIYRSIFWEKRNIAARIFAAVPLQEDEEKMRCLLRDKHFLVQSNAALALVRLGSAQGVGEIIEEMCKQVGYTYFFYKDILMQSSIELMNKVIEIYEQTSEPVKRAALLDIFASKTLSKPVDSLIKDMQSEDEAVRLNAMRALQRNPREDSEELLMKYLYDENIKMRELAALGLFTHKKEPVFNALKDKFYNDPEIAVKRAAAISLKKMGQLAPLQEETKEKAGLREIADYAAVFE